jgi:hypothetical protein
MCIFSLAIAIGVWFVPESPRWRELLFNHSILHLTLTSKVINKDRHEDAIKSLIRYHRNKDDPDNLLALSEYGQIKAQHDEDEKNKVTWKDMFTVPTYRRRAGVAAFVMIGSQMAATLLVSGMSSSPRTESY